MVGRTTTPRDRKIRLLASILEALLLASCAMRTPAALESTATGIPVAPEMYTFWEDLGGEETLGPPMQPAAEVGGLLYQVFLNAQLAYDREAVASESIRLYPLGLSLGLAEPPVPPRSDSGTRYFQATGHTLYAAFAQIYDRLGGQDVLGAPISEVKVDRGRTIQYFENIALYLVQGDPIPEVGLLALGLAACGDRCNTLAQDLSYVSPPAIVERPFASFMDRFGGEQLLGLPLTAPFLTSDGSIEQIYQRAVVYAPAHDLTDWRFRQLGEMLGPADPPVPPSYERGSSYFPETGHNVAWAFAEFYRAMQGELLLGLPLEEAHLESDLLTQRFQNGVLEYHYDLPAHLATQLAPLGEAYLASHPESVTSPSTPTIQPTLTPQPGSPQQTVTIETLVDYVLLPIGETQRITIRVMLQDGTPWEGVVPLAVVHGPRNDFFPDLEPTDVDGYTSLLVKLDDLRPGEIVNFEIVVTGEHGSGYAIGQFAGKLDSLGE